MSNVEPFRGFASVVRRYRFPLFAFLLPFTVRAIPELIAGPYPIGWDIIAFYVPNTLDIAAGKLGLFGILGSAPLMYAITVPVYIISGISPILIYKALGPVLFGGMCWAVFRLCRHQLRFDVRNSLLVVLFLSLYFVTLRLAWDAYQTELSLTLFLLGLTIPVESNRGSRGMIPRSIFFSLSILANQLVAAIVIGTVVFDLIKSKARDLPSLVQAGILTTIAGLVAIATLQGAAGPGISIAGQPISPSNLAYNLSFLVYALGPLLPLACVGVVKGARSSFRAWVLVCTIGIGLSWFPGQLFQDIGYRWVLLLTIPVVIAAARGYRILATGTIGSKWLRSARTATLVFARILCRVILDGANCVRSVFHGLSWIRPFIYVAE